MERPSYNGRTMTIKSNRPHAILILLLLVALAAPAWCAAPAKSGLPSEGDHATLRAAIQDLITTFRDQYPEGEKFLSRLEQMETSPKGPKARAKFLELQRQALTANPLVGENPILFVVRKQYKSDHHNSATMFHTGEVNTGKEILNRGHVTVWVVVKAGASAVTREEERSARLAE